MDYLNRTPANATVHEPYIRTISDESLIYDTTEFSYIEDIVVNDETDPVVIGSDDVQLAQTCWFREAENADDLVGDIVDVPDYSEDYSNFEAVEMTSADDILGIDFVPEYTVPGDDLDIRLRFALDQFSGTIEAKINGTTVYELSYPDGQNADREISWGGRRNFTLEVDDLEAGSTATFTLDPVDWYNGSVRVDCMALFDTGDRYDHPAAVFDYTFSDDVDTMYYTLPGPELYPSSFPVKVGPDERIWHVSDSTLETSIDDTSNGQALRLSPNGSEFVNEANSEVINADFDAAEIYGVSIHPEIVLSRYSSDPTSTPTNGDTGQICSSIRLTVATDDLALIDGEEAFKKNTWLANLQDLCDRAGYRLVVDHRVEDLTVEAFRRGDPDLVQPADWTTDGQDSVQTSRQTRDYYNIARVQGDGISTELYDIDDIQRVANEAGISEEEAEIPRGFSEPTVSDIDELRRLTREYLRDGVAGDQFSGSIDIVPQYIRPGYPYQPEEFGGRLVNAETVTFSFGADGSGSIDFGVRDGLTRYVQDLRSGDN
ncbi:hypothetical protein FGF80_10115 [Natrinema pallidum]|uniref:Uncharacterized protein n=1 Tax=Natrinema pallidum TaxID=69527 RepID=A0A4P9TFI2_9EURY|nr:hypothetical protein [Natrinema pallidum]QCW03573.1 hypothetical protein FGF80_10115 [Natrinema pallidum]